MNYKKTALLLALATCSMAWEFDPEPIFDHLRQFQVIADENSGSRAVFLGYNASVNYVVNELMKNTDYTVSIQHLTVTLPEYINGTPKMSILSPVAAPLELNIDFLGYNYGGSDSVSGQVQSVLGGCDIGDFSQFVPGNIALVNRNTYCADDGNCTTCSYRNKITNAGASGARGVLLYDPTHTLPTLGSTNQDVSCPVFGISSAIAAHFLELEADGTAVYVDLESEVITQGYATSNVIAETKGGYSDRVVLVGAHLDSVPAGAGINDNGSGSATILEMAIQFMDLGTPVNKVRFCWWAAEEWGLLGSQHYVDNLTADQRNNIALNLNFDMLGSPNYERGVYDGRNGPDDVSEGSGQIQTLFEQWFDENGLTYIPKEFNGRSDYGPFIEVGIPAGGLAAGAEEVKTPDQRDDFGGVANAALDTCYHLACDTFSNISPSSIREMGSAAAFVMQELAFMADLPGFLNPSSN